MTKTYTPRDLRDACAMPREDAVWFMEHCAEAWEADRQRLEEAERRCDPCGFTLAECMDARRAGKLACCPECNHPALAAQVPGTPAGEEKP